jgi:hypothetical protein
MDSSRNLAQRRAVRAPNRSSETIRLSRVRGQPVVTVIDEAAGPRRHDGYPIRQHGGLIQRMGDEDNGCASFAPDAQQLIAHQQPRLLIECPEWLIEQ